MSWTLCLSGSAILKAGYNVNPDIVDYGTNQTFLDQLSKEAEAMACGITGVDVVTQWGSLTANGRAVLSQYCSASIAQMLASYEPSAYSPSEFTFISNLLENQKGEAEALMKDKKFVADYLGGTVPSG